MGENHPRLALFDLRTLITSKAEGSLEAAKEYIESEADQIDKIIAIHLALEATSPSHPDWLVTAHNNAIGIELRPEIPSHRRLLAQRWYWREFLSQICDYHTGEKRLVVSNQLSVHPLLLNYY